MVNKFEEVKGRPREQVKTDPGGLYSKGIMGNGHMGPMSTNKKTDTYN